MDFLAIDQTLCRRDGVCVDVCPLRLIRIGNDELPHAVPDAAQRCIRCGHCQAFCPTGALIREGQDPQTLAPVRKGLAVPSEAALQLLRAPRSVRRYTRESVSRDLIVRLLDVTRHAPTAMNAQPVRWLVFDDRALLHELAGRIAEGLRAIGFYVDAAEAFAKGHDNILREAPALVAAWADADAVMPAVDCTIALTTFAIAAHAHGLGTCWAGMLMATARQPWVAALLDIPAPGALYGALMLGHPRHTPRRLPPRNPLRATWRP